MLIDKNFPSAQLTEQAVTNAHAMTMNGHENSTVFINSSKAFCNRPVLQRSIVLDQYDCSTGVNSQLR